MLQQENKWLISFGIATFLNLIGVAANWDWLRVPTKTLLMPFLMLYVWQQLKRSIPRSLLLTALALGWLGDIFLLPQPGDAAYRSSFFLAGLAAFLLGHLAYLLLLFHLRKLCQSPPLQPTWALVFAGLVAALFFFLLPHLGELQWPVLAYAIVLGTTAWVSTQLNKPIAVFPFGWIAAGGLLFMLSDSLLAWNKFVAGFYGAGVGIMLTYALAQLALTKGIVALLQIKKPIQ